MPSSRKGRRRRVTRTPLPIPTHLAGALARRSAGRDKSQPLLTMGYFSARRRWVELGLDQAVTFYSLRHSSIVRQLLANVPVRVVAAHHDTSVAMIEHTYSRHIGTVSDQIVRGSLIDLTGEAGR